MAHGDFEIQRKQAASYRASWASFLLIFGIALLSVGPIGRVSAASEPLLAESVPSTAPQKAEKSSADKSSADKSAKETDSKDLTQAEKPDAKPTDAEKPDAEKSEDKEWSTATAISKLPLPPEPNFLSFAGANNSDSPRKRVWQVSIEGEVDMGMAEYVDRAFAKVEADDVVVIDINTLGGRIDSAIRIRDTMLASPAPVVVFVGHRAISAGALITLAANVVIMTPSSSIGAATPVTFEDGVMTAAGEKVSSYMRSEMRATAQARGKDPLLAEAMVDADIEVKDILPKGKLLSISGTEARKLLIADALVNSRKDLLEKLQLGKVPSAEITENWGESFARWISQPAVSSVLMSIGLLGLTVELWHPGLILPGVIGASCLALYFGGNLATKAVGMESVILFFIGVVLLLAEVFVIPGFGVAGILGLIAIALSIFLGFIPSSIPFEVATELGYTTSALGEAMKRLGIVLAVLLIGTILFFYYFPKSRFAKYVQHVNPKDAEKKSTGSEAHGLSLPTPLDSYLGKSATAHTVLRPAGIIIVDGARLDALSEAEYIEAGSELLIVGVSSASLVVRRK